MAMDDTAGTARAHTRLAAHLHAALGHGCGPTFSFLDGRAATAGQVWSGAQRWAGAFRAAGLERGDRVVVDLPPSVAFVEVLVGALCEGVAAVVCPAGAADSAWASTGARLVVTDRLGADRSRPTWVAGDRGGPVDSRAVLEPSGERPSNVALVVRKDGGGGSGTWIALSDRNVVSVVEAFGPALDLAGARVVSILPWHRPFGLVLDLLASIMGGAASIDRADPNVDPAAPGGLVTVAATAGATHVSMVPLTLAQLAFAEGGPELLARLRGGMVGGAAVSTSYAALLAETRLRAVYGQSESTAGIALGKPGEWAAGAMGRPFGCQTRIVEGELWFRGANACAGVFAAGHLHRLPADRWVPTGDLVAPEEAGRLRHVGRRTETCKLANGRSVAAGPVEAAICALTGTDEAIVWADDEGCLEVVTSEPVDADVVEIALGSLAPWMVTLRALPPDRWVRMSDGRTDRRRTLAVE
jgi:acyl-CoA synthetase (AMP-forming)/AMP-acid ligase II